MWEFATPELGDHPQHILNEKIIATSELLVAVFHSRLGTQTPTASSGTVEEIREFISRKGPRRVLLYFCKRPIPIEIDPVELTRLNEFKTSMRKQGLLGEYTTLEEFERELYRHIDNKVRQLLNNELPLPVAESAASQSSQNRGKELPADSRLHEFIDFGTTLDAIVEAFHSRTRQFIEIDGYSNDKFYQLGAHVYTSAARCLDRFLAFSSAGMLPQDIKVLENRITRLKHLAANIPKPGSDFREYWQAGADIANDLVVHAAHIRKCRR